jgi:hypothetical protein
LRQSGCVRWGSWGKQEESAPGYLVRLSPTHDHSDAVGIVRISVRYNKGTLHFVVQKSLTYAEATLNWEVHLPGNTTDAVYGNWGKSKPTTCIGGNKKETSKLQLKIDW